MIIKNDLYTDCGNWSFLNNVMRGKNYYTYFWCNILPFILPIYQTFHSFSVSDRINKEFDYIGSKASQYVDLFIVFHLPFLLISFLKYLNDALNKM